MSLRMGIVSCVLSGFSLVLVLTVGIAIHRKLLHCGAINDAIAFSVSINLIATAIGIAGLFQKRGRDYALLGLVLSIAELILFPVFIVA